MLTLNKPHAFPKKIYLFAGYHLGCVADFIYPPVSNNHCRYPCSGQKTNSMHQRLWFLNSLSTPLANNNGFFI